jgi:Ca2+-transporting ATPase
MLSNRSRTGSLWTTLRTPNRTLWAVVGVTVVFLGLVLYWPWLTQLFYFKPLTGLSLLIAVGLGLSSVLWFEAIKFSRRRPR